VPWDGVLGAPPQKTQRTTPQQEGLTSISIPGILPLRCKLFPGKTQLFELPQKWRFGIWKIDIIPLVDVMIFSFHM